MNASTQMPPDSTGAHSEVPLDDTTVPLTHEEALDRYVEVQQSPEFQELRTTFRRFVFPVTAFFLTWYFLYVLLSIFAMDFMSKKVFGSINIGLLMGFGQFVTTFGITFMYARWARRTLDPLADAVGKRLDGEGSH